MDSYLGLNNILSWVDAAIQDYTQSTYHALSVALLPTLKLLMVLYIALFGVAHVTGRLPFDLWRTARHFLIMALVVSFVTQWDFFALYFGHLFTDGPAQLMRVVSGGYADPNGLLGDVLNRGILAANAINQMAGFRTLGFLIVGYSVFYMTLFAVGYALYLLVLSKLALAILLGLAPVFFLSLLFESMRDVFMNYVRQVFNFALIPIFTSAVLAIMLKIPQQALIRLQNVLSSHSGHGGRECVFVLLSFFIILLLLHQVTGFAAGVSGGGLQLHPGNTAAFALGAMMSRMQTIAREGKSNLGHWGRFASAPLRPVGRWMQGVPYKAGRRVARSIKNPSSSDRPNSSPGASS